MSDDQNPPRPRMRTTYGITDDGHTPIEVPVHHDRPRRRKRIDDDTDELPVIAAPLSVGQGVTLVADDGVIRDLADELAKQIFKRQRWRGLLAAALITALVVGVGAYVLHLGERIDRLERIHQ